LQCFLKHVASPKVLVALVAALRQYKSVSAGLLCFGAEAVVWTMALRRIDVSQAYPISSIELIVMLMLSRLMLRETISKKRWVGVVLIVGGTILVGLS
jgi:uncharacterized membrane protein